MVEKSARLITDSIIAEGLIAENLKDWYGSLKLHIENNVLQ